MSNYSRIAAVNEIAKMRNPESKAACEVSCEDYACDVFNTDVMRKYLPKKVTEQLIFAIKNNTELDPELAVDVAHAMKEWALSRGATHFTHWFQPLTGATAEKHDAFLEVNSDGQAMMAFSGKNLIVGEPDASSFPSGGLRSTFEARGYTAWDPTSPAFIKRHANGATLCIPTAFCSYTGDALDKKTPLLRSMQALRKSVRRLMKAFGRPEAEVRMTLGIEQEYFLIDKRFYINRPDLLQTGRTLFGAVPAKHQQLEDHYFGSIKPRVIAFMTDLDAELWKLGIPAKTRHNEVAPAQFEIAPIFEEMNLAIDHNMLVMDILRQVAERHGFVALMHEKPFAGVNGSGKHNNWSITYGKNNLLDPGDNPRQNAIFLTVLCSIIRAIDIHSDLLRSSTAYAGNDHRLGANEAPPAIISIFLGDQLTDVINQIENGSAALSKGQTLLKIGVDSLMVLPKDTTDRNRTSPFAFTGNKFEFRAPGSSQSCSSVDLILNTIVAESMDRISDKLESFGKADFNEKLQKLLQKIIKDHKRIIFNGDNYTKEWEEEAARRKLPNLKNTMEALKPLMIPENIELFEKYKVYSKSEIQSRYEVFVEDYHRKIRIEGGTALEIARSIIAPAVQDEMSQTLDTLFKLEQAKLDCSNLKKSVKLMADKLNNLLGDCDKLEQALAQQHEDILAAMHAIRISVDSLEVLVDDSVWPLPKYREMLFIY